MAEFEVGKSFASLDEPVIPAGEAGPALEQAPAVQRFQTCRWRKAAENGTPDHCLHRDVQPMAGTAGFSAEAWCPECGFYKVRRNPRKRPQPPTEGRYYY